MHSKHAQSFSLCCCMPGCCCTGGGWPPAACSFDASPILSFREVDTQRAGKNSPQAVVYEPVKTGSRLSAAGYVIRFSAASIQLVNPGKYAPHFRLCSKSTDTSLSFAQIKANKYGPRQQATGSGWRWRSPFRPSHAGWRLHPGRAGQLQCW